MPPREINNVRPVEVKSEVDQLREDIRRMRINFEQQIEVLKKENAELRRENAELRQEIRDLMILLEDRSKTQVAREETLYLSTEIIEDKRQSCFK